MPQRWSSPGSCRIVCVPVRRAPRRWTAKDVARVAGYAHEHGAPWGAIVAGVLGSAGLLFLVCVAAPRVARMLLWWDRVRRFSIALGPVVALVSLLRRIARVIASLGLRFTPRAAAALLALAAVLSAVAFLVEQLTSVERDVSAVRELSAKLTEWCIAAGDAVPELPELEIPDPDVFFEQFGGLGG